jgi:hypothetical protein
MVPVAASTAVKVPNHTSFSVSMNFPSTGGGDPGLRALASCIAAESIWYIIGT